MAYDDSASQTLGTALVLALSQGLPPVVGHPVAAAISYVLGNRFWIPTLQAICINQWLLMLQVKTAITKEKKSAGYTKTGQSTYDFYQNLTVPKN
jgi:hypothetical protein